MFSFVQNPYQASEKYENQMIGECWIKFFDQIAQIEINFREMLQSCRRSRACENSQFSSIPNLMKVRVQQFEPFTDQKNSKAELPSIEKFTKSDVDDHEEYWNSEKRQHVVRN